MNDFDSDTDEALAELNELDGIKVLIDGVPVIGHLTDFQTESTIDPDGIHELPETVEFLYRTTLFPVDRINRKSRVRIGRDLYRIASFDKKGGAATSLTLEITR